MSPQSIVAIIQFSVAPVVMVTSAAILIGGMLTRYAEVNDRLRALNRERLDLLHEPGGGFSLAYAQADALRAERLTEIDTQVPLLLYRHQLIHNAVLTIYGAVVLFVASMFTILAATVLHSTSVATAALGVFLAGMVVLLVSIVLIAIEVRLSNKAVAYEVERVMKLGK